jgi:hypothetical protein
MEITVRLLGELNETPGGGWRSLVPKKIVAVTAEQIATWFRYDSLAGKNPYHVRPDSLIQIDADVQRGLDDRGRVLQEAAKVREIRDLLLGAEHKSPIFLSTLVWVLRGNVVMKRGERRVEGSLLPIYELGIETDQIWLTDSAHRHFGIAEAYRTFVRDKEKYPAFSPKFEFPVEVYVLDSTTEKSLFTELNSKQKKVSASKTQQLDVNTAIGYLKSKILERDLSTRGLFANNIEVSFRENKRHTLVTMSAFVAAIREFFTQSEIEAARSGKDEAADMYAEYFCEFFCALADTLRITYGDGGNAVTTTPFYNLYREHIAGVVDREVDPTNDEVQAKFETDLEKARERANDVNRRVREADVTNSNPMLRSLARLARTIRYFDDWKSVVSRLQSAVIAQAGGRYFQLSNSEVTNPFPPPYTTPLITRSEQGTPNIQVQSQTVRQAYDLLLAKLDLVLPPTIRSLVGSSFVTLNPTSAAVTQPISRSVATCLEFEADVFVPKRFELSKASENLSLTIRPKDLLWKKAELTGRKRVLPQSVERDLSYQHPYYDDVVKYSVRFSTELPAFVLSKRESFAVEVRFQYPSLSWDNEETTVLLQLQPNDAY